MLFGVGWILDRLQRTSPKIGDDKPRLKNPASAFASVGGAE
jgi:hypothetical protein